MKASHVILILSVLFLNLTAIATAQAEQKKSSEIDSLETLGQSLYFDTSLSKNRTQSCATCHSPEAGFADPRPNASGKAFSLGDDGKSLGDRNAPTASYAMFAPDFYQNKKGIYVGGQFFDGREKNLQGQAGGPPLNPIEMGMPDKALIVTRLKENAQYVSGFKKLFGKDVLNHPEKAYTAMTKSIAAFEKTSFFAPFDSKYDRYLRGEYELTIEEELGMTLFFSQQFSNCNRCHQLKAFPESEGETFSNYEYHNIGVPTNIAGRKANGVALNTVDQGLLNNSLVDDLTQAGKFKTPILRNVAVTAPYMHNGVFKDLKTVVLFYNKYNTKSAKRQINPETGEKWRDPEATENISIKDLEASPALNEKRINALVAFMKTLTDKRYEHLLEE